MGNRADTVIRARGLSRTYPSGAGPVHALRGVDLEVRSGDFLAILGVSGSGKSTLLHCLGLVEKPDAGELFLEDFPAAKASEFQRALWRNTRIGFVFQSFHLVPELTALENILLPAMIRSTPFTWGGGRGQALQRARALLERMGLSARAAHRPAHLSGGERQRVALARALINGPAVLLADEPTGNLDTESGEGIIRLLKALAGEGTAVVVVTHNEALGRLASRAVRMTDGRLTEGF